MKVKKNDTVYVLTGKDSGKTGKVLRALPESNRIVVDGINIQKKHKKARSAQQTSAIVEQAGSIDASNVLVVCPKCGKATRVAHAEVDGKKVRVCKKCEASLDVKAEAKKAPAKKATKKAEKEVAAEKPAKKTSKKKSNVEEA